MTIKFLQSADGTRLIRLRSVRSVRLQEHTGNGFVAARIVASLRGGADPVILAAYTAVAGSPDAARLPARAKADMDRLLHLLNGGRLRKGEQWPAKEV